MTRVLRSKLRPSGSASGLSAWVTMPLPRVASGRVSGVICCPVKYASWAPLFGNCGTVSASSSPTRTSNGSTSALSNPPPRTLWKMVATSATESASSPADTVKRCSSIQLVAEKVSAGGWMLRSCPGGPARAVTVTAAFGWAVNSTP